MTLDQAHALSRDLAEAGISHTLTVGIHAEMIPAVQARVDLSLIRSVRGGIAARFAEIETIAARHGAVLESSLLSQGYTLAEARPALRFHGETEEAS